METKNLLKRSKSRVLPTTTNDVKSHLTWPTRATFDGEFTGADAGSWMSGDTFYKNVFRNGGVFPKGILVNSTSHNGKGILVKTRSSNGRDCRGILVKSPSSKGADCRGILVNSTSGECEACRGILVKSASSKGGECRGILVNSTSRKGEECRGNLVNSTSRNGGEVSSSNPRRGNFVDFVKSRSGKGKGGGGGGGEGMGPGSNPRRNKSGGGRPRICIWEREGEGGDITCDIVDGGLLGFNNIYNNNIYNNSRKYSKNNVSSPCSFIKEAKRHGEAISQGHKNYYLMLNLQLGLRYSIGKHSFCMTRELKSNDFDPKQKFWTRFPSEGSKLTPTHKSTEFWWKNYCPVVFRHLRDLFQVDPADYMLAICGNDALREMSSPGKSGSFFYLTQDDRFMIKTVKKSEVKVLLRMLPSYYEHVCKYENSLVTRFYGVHCVKPAGGPKTRFVIMGNLFCSDYRIHRRFDLKGSRHGRTTAKAEGEIDDTTTLKDLDLDFVFRLQRKWYQELMKQVERDCEFLEAARIMDYSLLVGIHFRDNSTGDKMGLSPFVLRGKKASYQNEKFLRGQRFLEAELQDMDRVRAGRKPLIRLGANMPARAERLARRSDFDQYIPGRSGNLISSRNSETYEVIIYFGIIDILQDYDITKRLEHAYKSLQADPTSISAVDPKLYSKRFRDFVGRIFVEDG